MLLNLFTKYDFYVKLRAMFVVLGLFHVLYLVLFIYINQSFLVLLNIFSIILYAACAYFTRDLKTSARAIMAVRIDIRARFYLRADFRLGLRISKYHLRGYVHRVFLKPCD